MKIGILTLPLHVNYGGILQAYALQTVLERMGHQVWIIEEKLNRHPCYQMPLVYAYRLFKKVIKREKIDVFYELHKKQIRKIAWQHIRPFTKKYINSFFVRDLKKLQATDFDAIIVGSDQIWRPLYYPEIAHAFLDFAVGWNIKKISYAASFGTDDWEYTISQTQICAALLKHFDTVTVREDSGVEFCSQFLGINACQVLDPTMLLELEDYVTFFNDIKILKSPGNLLCHILDNTDEKQQLVDKIAFQHSLQPFAVNSKAEWAENLSEECIQPPVEQFIRGFYDAEFVVTDSFHACVFSILFNRPFVVYVNKERGQARFLSLLKLFGLEKRLIYSLDEYYDSIMDNIDWGNVNAILHRQKEYSMNLLIKALYV